jgi:hypothetical protein
VGLLAWPVLGWGKVLNVEFNFTPYTGDTKADEVQTVHLALRLHDDGGVARGGDVVGAGLRWPDAHAGGVRGIEAFRGAHLRDLNAFVAGERRVDAREVGREPPCPLDGERQDLLLVVARERRDAG